MQVSGHLHAPGGWVDPRAGLDEVAKKSLYHPCQESNPGRSVRSLVTILTELSRLQPGQGWRRKFCRHDLDSECTALTYFLYLYIEGS
jgi:hypothetical protein